MIGGPGLRHERTQIEDSDQQEKSLDASDERDRLEQTTD